VFSFEEIRGVFGTLFSFNQRLVFLGDGIFASILTVISFFYLLVRHSGVQAKAETPESPLPQGMRDSGRTSFARMTASKFLLGLWIVIPLSGIILTRIASEAYIPMIFPAVILSISVLFNYIYKRNVLIVLVIILFISIINSYILIAKNYFNSFSFSMRMQIAKEIVRESNGRGYNLVGKGEGSQHKSFTMNYEYLTWWLGHPPSKKNEDFKFAIEE